MLKASVRAPQQIATLSVKQTLVMVLTPMISVSHLRKATNFRLTFTDYLIRAPQMRADCDCGYVTHCL